MNQAVFHLKKRVFFEAGWCRISIALTYSAIGPRYVQQRDEAQNWGLGVNIPEIIETAYVYSLDLCPPISAYP